MAALFGNKKEKNEATPSEKTDAAPVKAATRSVRVDARENIARILSHPRITEKATLGIDRGVYVFDVVRDANKKQIKEAIQSMYNVTPRKVSVVTIAKKHVRNARTGVYGTKGGGKKAYVYLKKGDTISIM